MEIAPTRARGPGPLGARYVVPITGGRFEGRIAPEGPAPAPFRGRVLPGGFDLQRLRDDGVLELEAIYHMETEDGVEVEVRNLCLLTEDAAGRLDYSRSRLFVEAPVGRYDWLNRRVFVGSVEVIRPEAEVLIRSFVVV